MFQTTKFNSGKFMRKAISVSSAFAMIAALNAGPVAVMAAGQIVTDGGVAWSGGQDDMDASTISFELALNELIAGDQVTVLMYKGDDVADPADNDIVFIDQIEAVAGATAGAKIYADATAKKLIAASLPLRDDFNDGAVYMKAGGKIGGVNVAPVKASVTMEVTVEEIPNASAKLVSKGEAGEENLTVTDGEGTGTIAGGEVALTTYLNKAQLLGNLDSDTPDTEEQTYGVPKNTWLVTPATTAAADLLTAVEAGLLDEYDKAQVAQAITAVDTAIKGIAGVSINASTLKVGDMLVVVSDDATAAMVYELTVLQGVDSATLTYEVEDGVFEAFPTGAGALKLRKSDTISAKLTILPAEGIDESLADFDIDTTGDITIDDEDTEGNVTTFTIVGGESAVEAIADATVTVETSSPALSATPTATIKLLPAVKTIAIDDAVTTIKESGTLTLTPVFGPTGAEGDVVWSIDPAVAGATILDGVLTTVEVAAETTITVKATVAPAFVHSSVEAGLVASIDITVEEEVPVTAITAVNVDDAALEAVDFLVNDVKQFKAVTNAGANGDLDWEITEGAEFFGIATTQAGATAAKQTVAANQAVYVKAIAEGEGKLKVSVPGSDPVISAEVTLSATVPQDGDKEIDGVLTKADIAKIFGSYNEETEEYEIAGTGNLGDEYVAEPLKYQTLPNTAKDGVTAVEWLFKNVKVSIDGEAEVDAGEDTDFDDYLNTKIEPTVAFGSINPAGQTLFSPSFYLIKTKEATADLEVSYAIVELSVVDGTGAIYVKLPFVPYCDTDQNNNLTSADYASLGRSYNLSLFEPNKFAENGVPMVIADTNQDGNLTSADYAALGQSYNLSLFEPKDFPQNKK